MKLGNLEGRPCVVTASQGVEIASAFAHRFAPDCSSIEPG